MEEDCGEGDEECASASYPTSNKRKLTRGKQIRGSLLTIHERRVNRASRGHQVLAKEGRMSGNHAAETAKIHAQLNHPVIDSDGHWIEFEPAAVEYLRQVGGDKIAERYGKVANQFGNKKWAQTPAEERRERRMLQPG